METKNIVQVEEFCIHCDIEFSFIHSLEEFELIQVIEIQGKKYLTGDQLNKIEKMVSLHRELNINFEGIDVIYHLLEQIEDLQRELTTVQNKLRLIEED